MDDAIVVYIYIFSYLLFLVINPGIISHSTCEKSKNKKLGVQHSTDSANRLEEKTEELGSELHLPSIFWGDNHVSKTGRESSGLASAGWY